MSFARDRSYLPPSRSMAARIICSRSCTSSHRPPTEVREHRQSELVGPAVRRKPRALIGGRGLGSFRSLSAGSRSGVLRAIDPAASASSSPIVSMAADSSAGESRLSKRSRSAQLSAGSSSGVGAGLRPQEVANRIGCRRERLRDEGRSDDAEGEGRHGFPGPADGSVQPVLPQRIAKAPVRRSETSGARSGGATAPVKPPASDSPPAPPLR